MGGFLDAQICKEKAPHGSEAERLEETAIDVSQSTPPALPSTLGLRCDRHHKNALSQGLLLMVQRRGH
jgi:hypothetical protein